MLQIIPIFQREAFEFIKRHHRHHKPQQGSIFCIACCTAITIVGVATVGRPTSRKNQDGYTAEVTRLCTNGHKNACSILYGACWRVAKNLGYKKLITFILNSESGTSLQAANWKIVNQTSGGSWNSKSRPRIDTNPTQPKIKFERTD